ncbi:hypothetical protein KM043_008371 [Ampulex compressa]|nr:hypothetical protein KM043_008371 [Ampulex compressa]
MVKLDFSRSHSAYIMDGGSNSNITRAKVHLAGSAPKISRFPHGEKGEQPGTLACRRDDTVVPRCSEGCCDIILPVYPASERRTCVTRTGDTHTGVRRTGSTRIEELIRVRARYEDCYARFHGPGFFRFPTAKTTPSATPPLRVERTKFLAVDKESMALEAAERKLFELVERGNSSLYRKLRWPDGGKLAFRWGKKCDFKSHTSPIILEFSILRVQVLYGTYTTVLW